MRFEIVALENPKDLAPDGTLPVKELFDGMPLAGCRLGAGKESASEKTDEKGLARIRLEKPGPQVVMAIYCGLVEGRADIDYRQFMSSWP